MLKEKKIGFAGGGQMCEAIFSGALAANAVEPANITITDILPQRLQQLAGQYGVQTLVNDDANTGIRRLAESCDVLVLAIKPQLARQVLRDIGPHFSPQLLVVSIIGGMPLAALAELMPHSPLVRVLPNTPLMVGCGTSAIIPAGNVTNEQTALCEALFASAGETLQISEVQANAFTAVSGCGPAYAYMFMEALAMGGVQQGLSFDVALRAAAKTVAGAAEMILQTETHPARLRDNVCSPGGATIVGVRALEDAAFRAAAMDAVEQSRKRLDELG